ncbi:MAG: DUF4185 domain-containing protein [Chthonomonadales bacterium]|nr:DUF4185 domain-containing protein [Chthonomonadales bacterium]
MSVLFVRAAALAGGVVGLAACFSAPGFGADPPYPSSALIKRIVFDFATHRKLAPGSDNWPMTWARDGLQYTSWGDGGGFGGTNDRGRVSNGFAVIRGSASDYQGRNIAGGFGAPGPAPFTGKCYGILAVRGALYAWRTGDGSGTTAYAFQEMWQSRDGGLTWSPTRVRYATTDFRGNDRGFFAPTFVQHGLDHCLARDGYVYTCAANVKTGQWDVHVPGEVVLLRAPERAITDPAAWTFYAGMDARGRPRWVRDPSLRRPIWMDRTGGAMMVSVIWHPVLRRYLLITEHRRDSAGNMGIFEAPELWGPWRTVLYAEGWGTGHLEPSTFYWNFAPAWWSHDGLRFVLVFTGTGANDAWNTVEGRIEVTRSGAR